MLFDRYYQAPRSRAKKTGLGLGLYIVDGLVKAHGGRIWVESQVGAGTTFFLWFPAEPTVPAGEAGSKPGA
jgi:signal transduction histidine kinase